MNRSKGFTLVELIIAMAVTAIMMVGLYAAVNAVQRSTSGVERKVAAQLDIKPALDLMAMEIGMASYNPTYAVNSSLWVLPPGVTGACVNNGTATYKGIQEATTTSITVEMDIHGTGTAPDGIVGTVGSGGKDEIIRYSYNAASQYITRETNCGGGQPFLGDTTGNTRAVQVINSTYNPVLPVFRYFNSAGTDITASLPGQIPNIRRILITLAVQTEDIDPGTGQRRQLIYSTSVIPRNHAISQ
ncbi:MAG: prepilin-type N-terminal cleavage/methylation domain-containing protein [Syntrophales bacterium]|nr:prepilin-type N-terminal cleavage/methylation domain-containing protein [Syntrophales bacterium]